MSLPSLTPDGNKPGLDLLPSDQAFGGHVALFRRHLCFAQARDLARSGHYEAARQLLIRWDDLQPAELDLLALIAARESRFSLAVGYWDNALALEPGHGAYLQRRLRAEQHHYRQALSQFLYIVVTPAVLLLLVLLMGIGLWLYSQSKQPHDSSGPKHIQPVSPPADHATI